MFPIHEQGDGHGTGMALRDFPERFRDVLASHTATGRATAFAFVFYDFKDDQLKALLKDQGVFTQLDRLSGDKLTLFFLHSGSLESIQEFNKHFLQLLGLSDLKSTPAVVFFRASAGNLEDTTIAYLDSANLIHGFQELYGVIKLYIESNLTAEPPRENVSWLSIGGKAIAIEMVVSALIKIVESLLH